MPIAQQRFGAIGVLGVLSKLCFVFVNLVFKRKISAYFSPTAPSHGTLCDIFTEKTENRN